MTLRDTLSALAGDTAITNGHAALVTLNLGCGLTLDDMIAHHAATLLHLLDRREFAENAVRARLPGIWRVGV